MSWFFGECCNSTAPTDEPPTDFNDCFISLYLPLSDHPIHLTLLPQIYFYGVISRTGFMEILGFVPLINWR